MTTTTNNEPYAWMKSPGVTMIALGALLLILFQSHGKMYYNINPMKIHTVVDILIAIVAAIGLGLVTFTIIIQSKKPWMPLLFSGLDLLGCFLFYGADLIDKLIKVEYAQGFYFSVMIAAGIYFLSEIFQERVKETTQSVKERDQVVTNLTENNQKLTEQVKKSKEANEKLTEQVSELKNSVATMSKNYSGSKEDYEDKINDLIAKIAGLEENNLKLEYFKVRVEERGLQSEIPNKKRGLKDMTEEEKNSHSNVKPLIDKLSMVQARKKEIEKKLSKVTQNGHVVV